MKGKNQKRKLFMLNRILEENTDTDHGLRMNDLIKKLKENGIDAERKSIREDIQELQAMGIDVGTDGEKLRDAGCSHGVYRHLRV